MEVGAPLFDGLSGNGGKAFHCLHCSLAVSTSDRVLEIEGKRRHIFINPTGIECDFLTFISCPGAYAFGAPTMEHTWFPGYQWRPALCRGCGTHLGWHYEALPDLRPREFWGILIAHLKVRP